MFGKIVRVVTLVATAAAAQEDVDAQDMFSGAKPRESYLSSCLKTTQEVGVTSIEGSSAASNMTELITKFGEDVIKMRVKQIKVCADDTRIHGIGMGLTHDMRKDPQMVQEMQKELGTEEDPMTYERFVGQNRGKCSKMELPLGVKVDAVRIMHDAKMIRSIEFKRTDNVWQLFGSDQTVTAGMDAYSFGFGDGEEIVGVFAHLVDDRKKLDFEPSFMTVPNHFASLGFIVNVCPEGVPSAVREAGIAAIKEMFHEQIEKEAGAVRNDVELLSQWNAKVTRATTAPIQQDAPQQVSSNEPIVYMIVTIVLALLLGFTCGYTFLKNRGELCKKKRQGDLSDFNSVEVASPTKAGRGQALESNYDSATTEIVGGHNRAVSTSPINLNLEAANQV